MHTKSRTFVLAALMISVGMGGCANAPTVRYATYRTGAPAAPGDAPGSIKFYLYGSLVTIVDGSAQAAVATTTTTAKTTAPGTTTSSSTKNDPSPSDQAKALFVKSATPKKDANELRSNGAKAVSSWKIDDSVLYALVPNETYYYKPNVSVTYVPSTYKIKTLGAAAEDNRVQIIQDVGGILAAAAAFAADATPIKSPVAAALPLSLPAVVDLTPVDFGAHGPDSCIDDSTSPSWCPITGTKGGWEYTVKVAQLTPGTVASADFFASGATSRLFAVPACQNITLSLRAKGDSLQMDYDLTVADPRRLSTFLIPAKGTIAPGDVCGADLTVTSVTSASSADIANAIAAQAAAVQKAIKASDPSTTSPTASKKGGS